MVQGDQRVARECYSASMKQKTVDNIYLDELDMCDKVHTRPEPSEELESVSLDDDPEHLAYIGSKLKKDLRNSLTNFLRHNKDVFVWKQADMGGIDPTVITHRLNTSTHPSSQLNRRGGASRQKGRRRSTRKSVNSSKREQLEKWNILNGWPTSYLSKKKMASDDSASTSLASTKRAQKIVSLCRESTSSWMPQSAMNSSALWMPSLAITRSAWTQTTKKRPRSLQHKEPIVIV